MRHAFKGQLNADGDDMTHDAGAKVTTTTGRGFVAASFFLTWFYTHCWRGSRKMEIETKRIEFKEEERNMERKERKSEKRGRKTKALLC